jgi:hypothetical protein
MALFRARYDGICAGCRKPFQKKMLIWAEKGRPPVHPHCKGALEKPPSAAVVESFLARLDEELRWHNQQYAADLEKWLSTQPEFRAKRDAALAEWEQRRSKGP